MPTITKAETLIKYFEASNDVKKYLKAYQDSGKRWTIGWGNTYNYALNRPVQEGDTITIEQANQFLKKTVNLIKKDIKDIVKVTINNNQFNALISFVFNLGIGSLKSSTLLKLLNNGTDIKIVAAEFAKWNKIKINGKYVVSNGLVIRRKAESDLFLS